MTQELNDGGPAFPTNTENAAMPGACYASSGMTLRDYFAIHASEADVTATSQALGRNTDAAPAFRDGNASERQAIARYAFADSMLKARAA